MALDLWRMALERAAALEEIAAGPPVDVIELGIAADDHEARTLGWPSVGAQAGMLAMVVAGCADRAFRIVPRGSTIATAKAADENDRAR